MNLFECVFVVCFEMNSRHLVMLAVRGLYVAVCRCACGLPHEPDGRLRSGYHYSMEWKGPSIQLFSCSSGTMTRVGLKCGTPGESLQPEALICDAVDCTRAQVYSNPSVLMVLMCLRSLQLKASVIKWMVLCVESNSLHSTPLQVHAC